MYPTMEVRWFYRGRIPAEVVAWYSRIGPSPEEQPGRMDHYLRLADNDSLGIKLREGRLEIKQRTGRPEVVDFHPRVSGVVERWRKWSFPLAENETALTGPESTWVAVEKRRRLRRYRVTGDKQVQAAPGEAKLVGGCELELTRLKAVDQQWWSLCFEAFGDEANLEAYLRLSVQHVVRKTEPPALDIKDSRSYPAWLEAIV
jgi:hypothetical protein